MGALSSCLVKSDRDTYEERKEVFDKTNTSRNFIPSQAHLWLGLDFQIWLNFSFGKSLGQDSECVACFQNYVCRIEMTTRFLESLEEEASESLLCLKEKLVHIVRM
jgi:hypothetical protein